MEYGYARVSAKDQNLSRQLDALMDLGLKRDSIFADKSSGKDFERPAYKRLMRRLKAQDVIYIKSIDRLGRNYDEIIQEWRHITRDMHAHIVVLDMPLLDTREDKAGFTGTFLTDLVLQILSYVAQIERENIHQRQAEGIIAAKARGVRFGRPRIERPSNYSEIKKRHEAGTVTLKEAASALNVSVSTFYNWLKQDC